MPQFSDLADDITVEFQPLESGCEMTFTQEITVIHEEGWTTEDIEKAHEDWKKADRTRLALYVFRFEGISRNRKNYISIILI